MLQAFLYTIYLSTKVICSRAKCHNNTYLNQFKFELNLTHRILELTHLSSTTALYHPSFSKTATHFQTSHSFVLPHRYFYFSFRSTFFRYRRFPSFSCGHRTTFAEVASDRLLRHIPSLMTVN